MQKGNFDILLLQETRTERNEKEIKQGQKLFNTKQILLTNYGTNSVGAGILKRNEDIFQVHHSFSDPSGRYIGVIGDTRKENF